MKKEYCAPEAETVRLESADLISASNDNDISYGEVNGQ
jgi:hypothetical protein